MNDPGSQSLDSRPDQASSQVSATGQTHVRILEMIVRAEPLESIMMAIVRAMAADPLITGGAILVLHDDGFEPIACSGISSRVLDHIRSVPVSDLPDDESLAARRATWRAICGVAIRPLISGAAKFLAPSPRLRHLLPAQPLSKTTSKPSRASPGLPSNGTISSPS